MIKEFYIEKLNDDKNIKISFNSDYKIIVAENGYGKTTILNALYALLSQDFSKLKNIMFEQIGIRFLNDIEISFHKNDIIGYQELFINYDNCLLEIKTKMGIEFLLKLIDSIKKYNGPLNPLIREASNSLKISPFRIRESIEKSVSRETNIINPVIEDNIKLLKENFSFENIYLPTYRRVEEDINRDYINNNRTPSLINFGMSDVQESINKITQEILKSTVDNFNKNSGETLSNLINRYPITEQMKNDINLEYVKIVLARTGKNIKEEDKDKLITLIANKNIFIPEYEPLVYFIANLMKIYKEQEENEKAIKEFQAISNKYLTNKEIIYDEGNVTINIISKKNKKEIELERLSSGEKQILSLFSCLYLEKKSDIAIFFDEPELSLSIEWQKMLLPDIINSKKCKFLFCTTHSPFIFDNELEKYTVDLSTYVEEL